MNKILKTILTIILAGACACSLLACVNTNNGGEGKTGLQCKKIDGVYTIYDYVGNENTSELNIATELDRLGIEDDNITIRAKAFAEDDTLTTIIVPEAVTKIEKGAFAGMKKLQTLKVPFVGKTSRADVKVGDTSGEVSEEAGKTVEKSVDSERTVAHFFGDEEYSEGVAVTINFGTGSSTDSEGTTVAQAITCYIPVTLREIVLSGSHNVPMCAFNGLNSSVKVTFAEGVNVEQIGEYAFANMAQLSQITLPTSVKIINKGAFSGASKLASVNFADLTKLENVGDKAFENTALTAIETPASLKLIGVSAFSNCGSLLKIKLNDGLEKISRYAFNGCAKLATIDTSSVIGSIIVGNYAFKDCNKKPAVIPTVFDISESVNAYPANAN